MTIGGNFMTRIALITGAGGAGIGAFTAKALARDGLTVVATDVELATAENVVDELPGDGHRALQLDVTDENRIASVFDQVELENGDIGVLVCAAGVMIVPEDRPPSLSELTTKGWDTTIAVNLRGPFLCLREMLKRRLERPVKDGRVVLISSTAGQTGGIRGGADYAASKAGIISLTKSAAREVGHMGMTVNNISPGPIETPLFRSVVAPGMEQAMLDMMPVNRMGQPDEIADMIAYLVSDKGAFITGSTVDVNGGYRMQ